MDFLRTLKKRKPKKHARAAGDRAKPRGIRIRRRGRTLNIASCIAFFLGLAIVTQGHTDDYYIYQTAKSKLVISNKEPPPVSTIIIQLSGETAPAQELVKPQPNIQPETSPKPTEDKYSMQPELILTALSYGLVAVLGVTLLVLSLISIS